MRSESTIRSTTRSTQIDQGLRSYMLGIYNYMALGLGLTGIVAFMMSQNEMLMKVIFGSPLAFVVVLAPIGVALFMQFKIASIKASTAQLLFWIYAGLMGVSLSCIFLIYTGTSIARTFFVTASMFGTMSLWGYTTKTDLTRMGSFLIMGLFGIVIASVVNMFMRSSAMHLVISLLGVVIFTGLTAYDTQMIKDMYYDDDGFETVEKKSIISALRLYLDFINLFLHLLRFMGDRK
jgi:FtsH-binding integral membrane protein